MKRRNLQILLASLLLAGCVSSGPLSSSSPLDAYHAVEEGLRYLKAGRPAEAEASFRAALATEPRLPTAGEGLAESLFRQRRAADSEAVCRRVLSEFPSRPRAREILGELLAASGRVPGACEQFQILVERNPARTSYAFRLARLFESSGAEAQALATMASASRSHPDDPEVALEQGAMLRRAKRLDESEACFRHALSLDDRNERAWRALAELYAHMDADHMAAEAWEKVVALSPSEARARRQLAAMYVRLSRLGEAERTLLALTREVPGDAAGHRMLGLLRLNLGQNAAARESFVRALALASADGKTWYYRAEAARALRRPREAEACLQKAVALDPSSEEATFALADATASRAPNEALSPIFRRAVRSAPRSEGLHLALALALSREGDLRGANQVLETGVRIAPENPVFRYNLGVNCHRLGLYDEAAVQFRRSLERDPENAEALNYLAYTTLMKRVRGGEAWEALRSARRAVQLWRANSDFRDTLGLAFLRVGRSRDAVAELKKALALGGTRNPIVWEHLGDAHAARGARSSALEAYRRSLALAPEHPTLRDRIRAVEREMTARSSGRAKVRSAVGKGGARQARSR